MNFDELFNNSTHNYIVNISNCLTAINHLSPILPQISVKMR